MYNTQLCIIFSSGFGPNFNPNFNLNPESNTNPKPNPIEYAENIFEYVYGRFW